MTWQLNLGSCLDPVSGLASLADKSVDVVITDPPYSEHVDGNFVTMGRVASGTHRGRPKQDRVYRKEIGIGTMSDDAIVALAFQLVRVAQRWIAVFCAWEQGRAYADAIRAAGGRYVRTCAWLKPDATPQLSGDRPAVWGECMILGHADAGKMRWNGGGKRGVYTVHVCRGPERSPHPTQKPLDLMLELVADFSDPGELVLDPFAGSGSTGVACNQLGRHFLGWELSPEYHAIAARRLNGDEAKPNPAQPSLFGGIT